MANQAFPLLNGVAQSWSDIGITLQLHDGPQKIDLDFADLKHESLVEVGEMYGVSGGRIMRRTTGRVKDTASMTLYVGSADTFEETLCDVAPTRGDEHLISLVYFDIIVQHTPPGATDIRKIEILGCRWIKRAEAYAEGVDPDKSEIDLSIAKIVKTINGKKSVLL